jgi:predicted transposase YdaD
MLEYAKLRREERAMVDVLEKALATENDIRVHQRLEGLERGEARKARQIAAQMLAMGMDPVVVAEATELSLDQLRDLDADG